MDVRLFLPACEAPTTRPQRRQSDVLHLFRVVREAIGEDYTDRPSHIAIRVILIAARTSMPNLVGRCCAHHHLPATASSFAERPNVLRQHSPEHRAARERISARTDALRHHLPARQTPCVAISGRCVVICLTVRRHLLSRPSIQAPAMMFSLPIGIPDLFNLRSPLTLRNVVRKTSTLVRGGQMTPLAECTVGAVDALQTPGAIHVRIWRQLFSKKMCARHGLAVAQSLALCFVSTRSRGGRHGGSAWKNLN
jgi:hypothetical protein